MASGRRKVNKRWPTGIIPNPMRKRGTSYKSLAYASGYDKQIGRKSIIGPQALT